MGNDTFAAAVGAIVESHKKLYALLLAAFESHKSGALPPRTKRVSRILDCEANGAHTILENLASAAKAAPRGSLGAEPDLLIAECRDFLDFLEDNLPSPDCAAAINDIRQTEESFVNLIKGLSGCDPNITIDDYSRRIDKFVHNLKGLFRDLGHAVVKYEYELRERGRKRQTKKKKRTVLKKNFYDKSTTEEWTQADAAKLLGISTRQLRRYKTNPPKDWPGWENPLALKKWKINYDDRDAMAFALKKSLSYKEGITEKHIKKFS